MISIRAIFVIVFLSVIGMSCAGEAEIPTGPDNPPADVEEPGSEGLTAEQAAKTALKVGDKMPGFELPDSRNSIVKSEELLKKGNLVVVFYRGGWCPFCNTYLKELQDELDAIESAGGTLVAISAENPDDSLSTEEKNSLRFHVLSDKDLSYARKFRLVYELAAETNKKYKENGIDLVVDNDMNKPELPISATYVVDQKGDIVFAFVEPDYKKRAGPEVIIEELNKLKSSAE